MQILSHVSLPVHLKNAKRIVIWGGQSLDMCARYYEVPVGWVEPKAKPNSFKTAGTQMTVGAISESRRPNIHPPP